jgi:hypothetical protein
MAFVPEFAPWVVLLFLASVFALLVAGAGLAFGAVLKNRSILRWSMGAGAAVLVPYAGLLIGASLLSHERVLAPGERKYFCEIDCHIAYSVERVTVARSLGRGPAAANAAGSFYRVALRTLFDEHTISPRRPKDAPLTPGPRRVYVEDATGRRFGRSPEGERALAASGIPSVPLGKPLIPGDSYVTELVFDLPSHVREPRLYVGDPDPVSRLLVGHEESPLHHKIWFRL